MTHPHPAQTSIRRIRVGDLQAGDQRLPINVHVIDHQDARILVDTGLTQLHPLIADMDPRITPLSDVPGFDPRSIDIVVNTHLHFDHVGGNRLFAGRPIYVQRSEYLLAHASEYTILDWVDAPGLTYTLIDGEHTLVPGVRLIRADGHSVGSQIVVVDTGDRSEVICGDSAVFYDDLENPASEAQLLIRRLAPSAVWLSHQDDPWSPTSPEIP